MTQRTYDLLIVGAGPAGLSAAIAAAEHGLDYLVLDKGGLVDGIFRFPAHMVFFTTPELLEIGGLPFVTPYDKPTRLEALKYYRRVADTYALKIAFHEHVIGVRPGAHDSSADAFAVETRSRTGQTSIRTCRAVVMATGYYDHPNRLGIPGEDLPHVSHYYTEAHPHYRRQVAVVGGKNSAAESALDLYRAGAHVTLVHRGARLGDSIKYWVKPDIDNRIAEGSIPAWFDTQVLGITPAGLQVDQRGRRHELPADAVFLMTGYHPDFDLLTASGVTVDPVRRVALYDPETLETNVRNLFLAGGVVSGRDTAPIFIENGRFHGEKIVQTFLNRR